MLYNNQGELLDLLRTTGLYTEKKLGQNFLFNPHIIDKILEAAELKPTDQIIEIGPGLGILTMELVSRVRHLTSIEKDPKLIPYLRSLLGKYENFTLIENDILEFPIPKSPYKVVANIPYYITSPIINHFLQVEASRQPSSLTILTQLEVAQKICASAGDHSILSLQTQLFAKPKIIDQVSPHNFYPAPKVKSAILHLQTLPTPRLNCPQEFMALIKKAFSQKRKTLSNTMQGFHGMDKAMAITSLEKANLNPAIRPQQLDFSDWARLLEQITPLH